MSFDWLNLRDPEPELPFPPMRRHALYWIIPILLILGLVTVVTVIAREEMRTSKIQAEWLSWYAEHITFQPEMGANTAIRYPRFGPYNQRLGYSYMPYFLKALQANDYNIAEQMRASPTYTYFMDRGLYPIYHPKTVAGITLYDRDGQRLYAASYPNHVFADFASIPPLLVSTLLFIENRELLKDGPSTRNPVIEWDRFFYARACRA
jgi:hypothetical protein